MGNRVLMQCINKKTGEFGPVAYGHWSGGDVRSITERLAARMVERPDDVEYSSARLVQEMITFEDGCLGYGLWNIDHILTADDSHGDAGVVLIDVSDNHSIIHFGGYSPSDSYAGVYY
jgi:hypothetical protein